MLQTTEETELTMPSDFRWHSFLVSAGYLPDTRKVDIVTDPLGNKIVLIQDVIFKGKRSLEWADVEAYLKQFVGEVYTVEKTADLVYIGKDLPDEYTHSNYTVILKGANAKAKANAVQGLPEIIEIATHKAHKDNWKEKHSKDAKYGWYKYTSRFALPVFDSSGEIERYNIFQVVMIVRHAEDGKMYLYDMMDIKKETSNLFQS